MIAILNDDLLRCPKCGGSNMHHGDVVVYTREEDDATTLVTRVSAEWGTAETQILPSDTAANPSPRRHGVRIEFECEECGHAHHLSLAQHKGETLVAWERAFGERPKILTSAEFTSGFVPPGEEMGNG
jgi:hypothetical protein